MKTYLFQSCGHWWVFQICWHIECSTFTASSFRIWNSSTGIPWPPLALFIVMLSKAHLTSHSRMSGSRWVITPLSLSGSWRSFLCSSSVYSVYLLMANRAFQQNRVVGKQWIKNPEAWMWIPVLPPPHCGDLSKSFFCQASFSFFIKLILKICPESFTGSLCDQVRKHTIDI